MKKNPLSSSYPEIAKQWHPTRNGATTPSHVSAGSNKKVWWKCPKGDDHEWEMSPNKRTSRGDGCTICSNRKIVKSNCLKTKFPEISKEWHYAKNKNITPQNVGGGSNFLAWWKCSKNPNHEWRTKITQRTSLSTGCPICSHEGRGKRRSTAKFDKSISALFPEVAKTWDYKKNKDALPENVYPTSTNKYYWICNEGHPSYQMRVAEKVKSKYGCPICAKQGSLASKLKARPGKSLADLFPHLVPEWNSQKNNPVKPQDINPYTHRKFWWNCLANKNHTYLAPVSNRTNVKSGCPYCRGLKVNETNSLFNLSQKIANEWHPTKNGVLTPHDVSLKSHKKVWWQCQKNSKHIWQTGIANRQNTDCPYCFGQKVLREDSFGAKFPKLLKEWNYKRNGALDPFELTSASGQLIWWQCSKDPTHEWRIKVGHRAITKTGCPYCTLTPQSKQELQISFELKSIFPEINPKGIKLKVGNKLFAIDIYIPTLKLCIEFDGSYWHKTKEHIDVKKTNALLENGYNTIRIREQPLKRIFDSDIISETPFNAKEIVNNILKSIINGYSIDNSTIEIINQYFQKLDLQNANGLEEYIENLLTERARIKKEKK